LKVINATGGGVPQDHRRQKLNSAGLHPAMKNSNSRDCTVKGGSNAGYNPAKIKRAQAAISQNTYARQNIFR